MWRPSEELRIPSWISVAIACSAVAFGLLLGSSSLTEWDQTYGNERAPSLVKLMIAGGSFVVAAVALMFARSGLVFWLGLAALFLIFAVGA